MILLLYRKKLHGTQGSRLGLSVNAKISVNDLLYGLLMVSGNDCAVALAEYICGSISSFADIMNKKAIDLNLTNTHFVSPHGLDHEEHYTTAYELAILSDYALKNETFANIVKTHNYTVTINGTPKQLHNTNELLGYLDGIYGVKTGFTNGANRCLVSSCKRNNLDIICVVLGCDTKKDRTLDSIKLINYIFNNFSLFDLKNFINESFQSWKDKNTDYFLIEKSMNFDLDLHLNYSQIPYENIAVNSYLEKPITISFTASYDYIAPVYENTIIGSAIVHCNGTPLFSIDIINRNCIKRKNMLYYLKSFAKDYFSLFY